MCWVSRGSAWCGLMWCGSALVQLLCSCGSGWCDLSVSGSAMVQLWIIIWLHLDRLLRSFGCSCSSAASGGMMITMRQLWCRVVPDCVCDRGVACGAVVQLGVISVCNECTQFQFGSALRQLGVA